MFGAIGALVLGAMSALLSCPSGQHSKVEGGNVDGVGVRCLDDRVKCIVEADASMMRFGGTCGLSPQEERGSFDVVFDNDQFVYLVWQLQAIDHTFHYSVGDSVNDYRTTWREFPQGIKH